MSCCNDGASSYGGEVRRRGQPAAGDGRARPDVLYLVLSGCRGQSGTASINFQHLPVGSLPAVYAGEMGIGSSYLPSAAPPRARAWSRRRCTVRARVTFWWRHCSSFTRYNLAASTCNAGVELRHRRLLNATGSADLCNDDLPSSCPRRPCCRRSTPSSRRAAAWHPRRHGRRILRPDSVGNYVLTLYGSAVIAGLDFERGVCRPRPHLPPPAPPPARPADPHWQRRFVGRLRARLTPRAIPRRFRADRWLPSGRSRA